MSNIFAFLWNFITVSIPTWLSRPPAPVPPTPVPSPAPLDVQGNLVKLILANTEALGPFPGTGGQVFPVDATEAATVAGLIIKYAAQFGLRVSLVSSLIRGESDFSSRSIDPNDGDAVKGETPLQAAEHTDYGIEQEDGSTAIGDPAFAGKSLAEIIATLTSDDYGVHFVCQTLAASLAWAQAAFEADPTLASRVPNGNHEVLATESYNAGQTGALTIANTKGLSGDWSYGSGVINRADGWASLLDG